MNFKINNRPKLPRNRFGWVDQGGNGGSGSGGSGLDSNTLNSIYDLIDWFYKVGDVVHSRYSFAGDYEVAAFRDGSSGVVNTYNASWIDSSFAWLIGYIGDSSATGDGTHIPDSSIRAWNDAADKSHTHDNKSVLDSISGQDLVNWRDTALDVSTWFYWDNETGTLHTPFDFIGDKEVAAYGNGLLGDISTYNSSWIDSSYAYLLNQIENVSGGSGGGGADIPNASVLAWNEAYNKAHTHNNKAILDAISDSSISVWNEAYIDLNDWFYKEGDVIYTNYDFVGNKEVAAHGNGSLGNIDTYDTSFIDSSYRYILDLIYSIPEGGGGTIIPDPSIRAWNNAANLAHEHTNKAVLDGITDSSISMWNETAENLNDWFFFDNDTSSVVTPYNLRSQKELTAYNTGESADADAYTKEWSDASYAYIMDRIDNISINIDISDGSIDLSGLVKNVSFNKLVDDVCNGFSEISNDITNVSSRVNELEKLWWLDGSTINTSFHIVGYGEINAYGQGEGAETDSYTQQHIDTSYNYIINLIENISTGGDITIDDISGFVKDISFNKLVDDVCNGFSGMSGDINNVSTRVNDLSIYVDGLNVNINDVSNKLNSWFYIDSSGNLNTSLNLIGHKEIMAWGKNDSAADTDSYTREWINASYNHVLDLIDNISINIEGDVADMSIFVRNTEFERFKTDVCNGFTGMSGDINNVSSRVNDLSLFVDNMSLNVFNNSTGLRDISADLYKWFYWDNDTSSVVTKHNLRSEKEILAYGQGQSTDTDTYTRQYIDSSFNQLLGIIDSVHPVIENDLSIYAKTADVNTSISNLSTYISNNYILRNDFNSSTSEINASIGEISTRLSEVSTRLSDTDSSVKEFSRWFWKDSAGNIHCSANFIGEHEVMAFGLNSSTGSQDTYTKDWINASYIYLDNRISNIDITGQLGNYATKDWTQTWVNSSLDNYVKKTAFNSSYNELSGRITDVRQGVDNANASITEIKRDIVIINNNINSLNDHVTSIDRTLESTVATVDDLSTRVNDVSAYAINTNNTLNDWFYFQNNKLYTKYDFISEGEICAYNDAQDSGSQDTYTKDWINASYIYLDNRISNIDITGQLGNYATKDWVNTSLGKYATQSWVNTSLGKYATQSWVNTSLGKYATQSWVNTSLGKYATQSWVNTSLGKYVKKTDFDTSYNGLLTYMSENYVDSATWNLDKDRQNTTITANSASIGRLNSSVSRFEEWFYIDDSSRVHCKNSFVGDEEVAAWGAGDSGGEIDLTNYVKIHADGQQTIESPIYVYDELSADDIYSFGDVRSEGDVTAVNDISAWGNLKIAKNASINGTLKVGGISNFNSSIIAQNASINGRLKVNGISNFNSSIIAQNASINGRLKVGGTTTLTGNSSINASLFVKNDVSIGGTIFANQIRTPVNTDTFVLNSNTQISGNTTISGNLTLPSAVSRIQIGPTTIGAVYDSSIIFGNTNFASIRARIDPNNNRTKLVLSSGDILSFSGSYANIDCEFNHGGEDITGVGTIYCDGVDTGSDRRLKTNIKDLEFKGSLNPVEFDMISTGKHSIGFIAQDLEINYPQVVHKDENGYLSLDYPKITAILSAQINYLEDKITILENKLKENGLI